MKFAREVSNRVFYMDEGGIYEEGTPGQIFDHPQREKTREFIRQLKTLRLEIPSSQINYYGIVEQFKNYCTEIMEDTATGRNMMLTFEEIVMQNIFKKCGNDPETYPISLVAEYSKKDDTLTVDYTWGGERFDPMTEGDGISAMIVSRLTKDLKYSYDGKNHISILL